MQKRGLAGSETFAYLITIVIVGLIFIMGYQYINSSGDAIDKSEANRLQNKINSDVNLVGKEQGRSKTVTYDIPDGVNEVCFVDLSTDKLILTSRLVENYPTIKDAVWSQSLKNVFMFGEEGDYSFYAKDIRIPHFPYFYCYEPINGKIEVGIEGLGRGSSEIEAEFVTRANINSNEDTVLMSHDEVVTVTVKQGTTASANEITVEIMEPHISQDVATKISDRYRFGPAGATFDRPVDVEIKYNPNIDGDCPTNLLFWHFKDDDSIEVIQAKDIDCNEKTATFEISSFSEGQASKACRANDLPGNVFRTTGGGNAYCEDGNGNPVFRAQLRDNSGYRLCYMNGASSGPTRRCGGAHTVPAMKDLEPPRDCGRFGLRIRIECYGQHQSTESIRCDRTYRAQFGNCWSTIKKRTTYGDGVTNGVRDYTIDTTGFPLYRDATRIGRTGPCVVELTGDFAGAKNVGCCYSNHNDARNNCFMPFSKLDCSAIGNGAGDQSCFDKVRTPTNCGNGQCQVDINETAFSCPVDCQSAYDYTESSICGDNVCDTTTILQNGGEMYYNEDCVTCPADCKGPGKTCPPRPAFLDRINTRPNTCETLEEKDFCSQRGEKEIWCRGKKGFRWLHKVETCPMCSNNQKKFTTCADGTQVDTQVCTNGQWVDTNQNCGGSPTLAPTPPVVDPSLGCSPICSSSAQEVAVGAQCPTGTVDAGLAWTPSATGCDPVKCCNPQTPVDNGCSNPCSSGFYALAGTENCRPGYVLDTDSNGNAKQGQQKPVNRNFCATYACCKLAPPQTTQPGPTPPTGQTCVDGETKSIVCADGTTVDTDTCVNNDWQSTGNVCAGTTPPPTPPPACDAILCPTMRCDSSKGCGCNVKGCTACSWCSDPCPHYKDAAAGTGFCNPPASP